MNLLRRTAAEAPWNRWYRRVLPSYWVFLFCVTHFPELRLPGVVPATDKWAHLVAFGLLAFLYWRSAEASGRPLRAAFVWAAGALLIGYAAVDEYLQQFVGRSSGVDDFAFDAAGIGVVLGLLELQRRRGASTAPGTPADAALRLK